MKERCRFCYKAVEAEFCKNIFNNKQTNPSICKIVEMLTNLTIVENDPYTKLACVDCFDVLILFYHFRESVLQTNRLLIDNKSNNANNNNNQNVYKKWPGIVRDNNGRFILIDISLYRESDSTDEYRNIDENNQDSNKYIEQSQKNDVFIEKDNEVVFSFIKQEFDIDESCVKIENDSDDEDQKIDENDYHLSIQVTDDNNVTVCSAKKISNNYGSDKHCSEFTNDGSDIEKFISIIKADTNENQELQKDNSYSNQSVVDNDNSDKVNNLAVVYVQDYNDNRLETTSVECQKKGNSNQHKNYKKHSKQPNECNICKEKFSKKSDLYLHLEIHSNELPHQCNICDEKFPRKGDLKGHLLIHNGEKPIQCNICDKRFKVKGVLKRHLLIHTGEKPHQCNICNRKFTQKAHLKQHSLIHTGEKPHVCNICDKKFTLNGDLKKHLLIHTGEKPHKCNICEKKFTLREHLKHHLLTHTGEKPHQCDICDRKFIRKDYLKYHLLTHTDEKPHQCNICGKKFTRKEHLKQHLLTHSGENFKRTMEV